eukprot:366399-Chlamydomonas_euryale.AAC.9
MWTCKGVQMGRLEVTHFDCLRCIVDVKLTDRHKLETIHEQCGTSSLELMQAQFAEDGRMEQL